MGQVIIKKGLSEGDGWSDRKDYPLSDTDKAYVQGQLMVQEAAADTMEHMNAAGDDAIFCGVCIVGHSANPDDFRDSGVVLQKCLVEMDVTSASYDYGDPLKYAAGSDTVDYSLVADAGANTIAWAAETKTTATRLLVRFDVWALQKLLGVSNA